MSLRMLEGVSLVQLSHWRDSRDASSLVEEAAISSTDCSKAFRLTFDGARWPLIFRTNCNAAAWISSTSAEGSRTRRFLMLRHIPDFLQLL